MYLRTLLRLLLLLRNDEPVQRMFLLDCPQDTICILSSSLSFIVSDVHGNMS